MQSQLALDILVSAQDRRNALLGDVRSGLVAMPKSVPPVWFYDETGSRLFDAITRLPEYYPTRTEAAILRGTARSIVGTACADTLVEIGSGTSEKTRLLLDAMAEHGRLRRIVLFDISLEVLAEAAAALGRDYDVEVHAIVGDFRHHLRHIPRDGRQLWAFLGGTIGNLTGAERAQLLFDMQTTMKPGDHLLLGTDLVKAADRLLAAYDDRQGVTAAFNRNLLNVLNNELGAAFEPSLFDHVALWNADREWIEMRLRSRTAQDVAVPDLGLTVRFDAGEDILTEISAKFRPQQLTEELLTSGLVVERTYRDARGDFQLTLVTPGP